MWQLDSTSTQPIYQKIVALVLAHLKAGRLLPGEKLPPERQLAQSFDVNRSTVVHALDELEAMGVIIRRQGSGTTINDGKWGVYTGSATNWRSYLSNDVFSQEDPYRERLKVAQAQPTAALIDASDGELPLELIPSLDLPAISWHEFLQEESLVENLGYLPLRQGIVDKLNKEEGLDLAVDQLLLTSGAQQALYLITQVLLRNGDGIAIEEPSSFYNLAIFQAAGIRLFGIPVDQEGMRVDLLEEKIIRHQLKMVIINPNFQNPTGTVMSLSRRQRLLELCRQYEIPVVEDDVFRELYFEGQERPPLLKTLDSENVIYIGSLSKILGATTKIGWVSAPARVTAQLGRARQEMDFSLSIFPQVLATSALTNPAYEGEILHLRQELSQRCDYLVAALKKQLGQAVRLRKPQGGLYLWLESPKKNWRMQDFKELLEQEVLTMPGFLFGGDTQALRLNFAALNEQQADELARRLGQQFGAL